MLERRAFLKASLVTAGALSLPAGLTAGGLPVGLELDGPLGSDTRLIAIGMAVESLLGALPAPPL